jgi:hypothetical protein
MALSDPEDDEMAVTPASPECLPYAHILERSGYAKAQDDGILHPGLLDSAAGQHPARDRNGVLQIR